MQAEIANNAAAARGPMDIDGIADEAGGGARMHQLNFDAEPPADLPPVPEFYVTFNATHKAPCTVAAFSPDAALVATGSADTVIKLLVCLAFLVFGFLRFPRSLKLISSC